MSKHEPRPFSDEERAFLESVADKLPPSDCERLRHDIQIARLTVDGDFLLVDLMGYERPDYKGHRNLPFEGEMRAADGSPMTVLVNIDRTNGFSKWSLSTGRARVAWNPIGRRFLSYPSHQWAAPNASR